ncbi:carbohydrate kinase [Lentilitoribacter sp. Alg239-R112]|uniref:carbohydrate kinase family protein n=1 Tax=Lentilitoribacter sp. Alg239-R112 TaxID=2305987 RepID=UPI0013A6DD03|nr:carbohydrate kinase [Lentilitoribacter sp. Alg239-R112]
MIVCCGEALIDMLPRKLTSSEDVFLPVPGGAIFNTAIALGRLGEDVGFISGISTDMFGTQLVEALNASHVSESYCIRNDQPTTLAFVKLTDGNAKYSFFDEQSAGRNISQQDLPTISADVEALHFGAISLIPEPCGSTYETLLLKQAPSHVISLDPNIRISFIKDAEKHRARIKRMAEASDIIKVSDEDLAWIAETSNERSQIDQWLSASASIVIITRGGDGADVYTKNYHFNSPAIKTTIVDTVGAGDTFNAGLLSGLKRANLLRKDKLVSIGQDDLEKAVHLANKVASITVSRAGANPPWKHEL